MSGRMVDAIQFPALHLRGELEEKILAGERIDREEALALYHACDLLSLGAMAHALSLARRPHAREVVTYVVDRNINYTNVCLSQCRFCAFWRPPGHPEAYVISWPQLAAKLEETLALGGNQILLQGGLHPELDLGFYEELLARIRASYPIHVHGFSPPEILHIARQSRRSVPEVLKRLKAAGLGSIPGGGAEVLVDRVRTEISPQKCTAREWLGVMEAAHRLGLRTTATMMFGQRETVAERIEHLLAVRALQDRTGGFTAFIPWPFQPQNTALGGESTSALDYLKTLALSRIVLDNFANLQASWVTQGPQVGQIALLFGANDLGSTMIEENVVRAAGTAYCLAEAELRRLIADLGLLPRRRNVFYELLD
ncbi:MAG: dehypoxanthine futalosine cyclase [Candidatus Tectomicrobia bacterium]|uniref:Cyclic dehypoxanthine futalosine synthase n=1 Tax=Tectimicrobiota bacterium TaxID=2528274 RepID=A0A932CPJ2_UNCTE|nr:dehypoxanthine futalosine cyclase [Candidatus Tectomicrobia bacterium]